MRDAKQIAFISDIHSNVFALDAVLADIKRQGIRDIVNLGDILYGAIAPQATFSRLQALSEEYNVITICGNQDRQIFEATDSDLADNVTLAFILRDLNTSAIHWMQNLPFDCRINDDIYVCHGTPDDDMIYLLEDVQSGYPEVRADTEILRLLAGNTSPVIVCGHSHIPRTVQVSTGQLVINSGSVGYPAYQDDVPVVHRMQTFAPHASYSIVSIMKDDKYTHSMAERFNVRHCRIAYDHTQAAQLAKKNGREDWYHSLMTGRVSAYSKN